MYIHGECGEILLNATVGEAQLNVTERKIETEVIGRMSMVAKKVSVIMRTLQIYILIVLFPRK